MVGKAGTKGADEYAFMDSSTSQDLDAIAKKLDGTSKKDALVKLLKVGVAMLSAPSFRAQLS